MLAPDTHTNSTAHKFPHNTAPFSHGDARSVAIRMLKPANLLHGGLNQTRWSQVIRYYFEGGEQYIPEF